MNQVISLSIHFPLTREDTLTVKTDCIIEVFQSTSLSRGKTGQNDSCPTAHTFQSTSLSRGKTRCCDWFCLFLFSFNPLPSHEGRQSKIEIAAESGFLSIHFPLTREDGSSWTTAVNLSTFNPLPSHEGRLGEVIPLHDVRIFQSTSLSRGKTSGPVVRLKRIPLSIHFPLTREDSFSPDASPIPIIFQSTSLSRGKTGGNRCVGLRNGLSIHFPLTREDSWRTNYRTECYLSIHFPLTREDSVIPADPIIHVSFNPLPSHEGRQLLSDGID